MISSIGRRVAVMALLAGAMAAPLAGQTVEDSLQAALQSPDWTVRHRALQRINELYPDTLPPSLVNPVVILVQSEATHPGPVGEGYGEYVMTLLIAAGHTYDPRVVQPVILLGGPSVSGALAGFLAGQGPRVFALMDSLFVHSGAHAPDVVETYAMMYARHGELLARADSAHVLALLTQAALDPRAWVRTELTMDAPRGPFPELVPLLEMIADSDPYRDPDGSYTLRRDARHYLTVLQPMLDTLSPGRVLTVMRRTLEGVCVNAAGALRGHCEAMEAFLATADRQLAANHSEPVREALQNLRNRIALLRRQGLLAAGPAVFLDGNAAALLGRL